MGIFGLFVTILIGYLWVDHLENMILRVDKNTEEILELLEKMTSGVG